MIDEMTALDELGARAIAALWDENHGNLYHRMNVVKGRAIEAVFARVLGSDG